MSLSAIGRLRQRVSAGDRRAPVRCGPRLEALEDRTLMSVSLVKDINTAPQSSSPNGFTDVNGVMFFHAYDPVHGQELWKTDGTTAGTTLVKEITPGWAGATARPRARRW
jgi:ELWxxDGT repeat protein